MTSVTIIEYMPGIFEVVSSRGRQAHCTGSQELMEFLSGEFDKPEMSSELDTKVEELSAILGETQDIVRKLKGRLGLDIT